MKRIAQVHVAADGAPYKQTVTAGRHTLVADEPASAGGADAGAAPYQLLLASLGACTTMTLQTYAARKGWHLGDLSLDLTLDKGADGATVIHRVLHSTAALDAAQWDKLLEIAGKTPVTKTLLAGATIHTERASD